MKNILYIGYNDKILEYPLPAVNDRECIIALPEIDSECHILMDIFDNNWVIKKSENVCIFENKVMRESCLLESGKIINIKYKETFDISIIVHALSSSVMAFKKYDISNSKQIRIGQADECEISIKDSFISRCHAVIFKKNEEYFITDQSTNGTYINGVRVKDNVRLSIFDVIYTVGFKIVFLGNVIAVNRVGEVVTNLAEADCGKSIINEKRNGGVVIFSTAPRSIDQLEIADISIDAPPVQNKRSEQPLLFLLGPSLTMPIPMFTSMMLNMAAGTTTFTKVVLSLSTIVMSTVIGTGWALARNKYAKKTSAEAEKGRIDAYRKYLSKTAGFLTDKHIINRNTLNIMYPPINDLIAKIYEDSSILWNHSPRQDDFLSIRLGKGSVDFPGKITVPAERFSVSNDELAEKPYELYENFRYINDAVSLIELKKHKIVGVIGNEKDVNSIAVNMLLQIVSAYSYIDVKTAVFYDDNLSGSFEWTRWLPHTFTPDKKLRMTACGKISAQSVLYYLTEEFRKRCEDNTEKNDTMLPYYIVFCTNPDFFENEVIEKYITSESNIGACFVLLYKESVLLPNACKYVIRCDDEYKGRYALDEKRTLINATEFDAVSVEVADKFARRISGMYIKELSTGEIPSAVDYLDMLGIGKVEQWDLLRRYKENRVYEHIRSFVGITTGNKPMYIDIHEKKYGPHGLVAGTTGSGKSETIQTFIISLAMNYHPNEVAFILIDYKGGGMANAFIGMPHLAGTITNLSDMGDDEDDSEKVESIDGSQTRRALISIKSEIKRRQAIFNQYKVNHIDLYIRLFREGKAQEPLPHLIIISDEFAELKKEQPEFIKELVSTARVGRSLGIHLILATQKPAGVVDDEIWSNSRFKICLRVQDRQDSNGMLKRPDAAYITQTGRAYLQIGNDEIFEMFQSGYSGAEYEPKEEISKAGADSTEMIEIDGSRSVCRSSKKIRKSGSITQLEACSQYISKVCRENNIKWVRPLWLPQLPKRINYHDIADGFNKSSDGIIALFGMIDNPEKQSQYCAAVNLTGCGNLLISGSGGSGKSVLIQTMLYSITLRYTSEQVNYYIFDFSGHILKVFNKAPHCGGVVFADDEEAIKRTLNMLCETISKRKKLFNETNVGSFAEYRNVAELPLIVLVIDNYFVFNEMYEALVPALTKILRDGSGCGIEVILSISHQNDIKYRQRQNVLSSIALKLADRAEYHEALGAKPEFLPMNCKGRGIMHSDGTLLEFQAALASDAPSEFERSQAISEEMAAIAAENKFKPAAKIPIIPKQESYSTFLESNWSNGIIPLGYDIDTISVINFTMKSSYCFSMYSYNAAGISLAIDSILCTGRKAGARMFYCGFRNNEIKVNTDGAERCRDYDSIFNMLLELKKCFSERSRKRYDMLKEDPDADTVSYFINETQPVFIIIDSFNSFLDLIYDTSNAENMYSITETLFKQGEGHNVYFFAGFDGGSFSGSFYKQACKLFTSYKCGIALGGRLDSQNLFEFQLSMSTKMKTTNPNIGYIVDKSSCRRIHLPTMEIYDEE